MEVKLEIDPTVTQLVQKPRNVPYHQQKPLKQWLDKGIEKDIFEKVLTNEAITWCSPLVVQTKPKFAETKKDDLEPHTVYDQRKH